MTIPDESDPFRLFERWQQELLLAGGDLHEPGAAALATISTDGLPAVRMVLVKAVGSDGCLFYTNYGSRKAAELDATGRAAILFHWPAPPRQVRIEGRVERLARAASEAYFATRPRDSQLGAWASRQSAPLQEPAELTAAVARARQRFAGEQVPCPDFWGGYRLTPVRFEFWQGRPSRLHDRLCFERDDGAGAPWTVFELQP